MLLFSRSHPPQRGMTAVALAAHEGHLEVVIKLAELGADLAPADTVSKVVCINHREGCGDNSEDAIFMLTP